jgi:hypothetical protein
MVLWAVALAFACLGVMKMLGAPSSICFGGAVVLSLATARSFGYLRSRWLRLLRRRLSFGRDEEPLPDIAGYLPFK